MYTPEATDTNTPTYTNPHPHPHTRLLNVTHTHYHIFIEDRHTKQTLRKEYRLGTVGTVVVKPPLGVKFDLCN